MPRIAVLTVLLLVLAGAMYFLSSVPTERPTSTIEVAVPQPGAPGGNAR
jgi:hypothetical protein